MINRRFSMMNMLSIMIGVLGIGAIGTHFPSPLAGVGTTLTPNPSPQQSSRQNLRPNLRQERQPQLGEVVTLSSIDELSSAFDFNTGRHVTRFENDQIDLNSAEIAFNLVGPERDTDWLSYGFVRLQEVALIDLGDLQVNTRRRSVDLSPKPTVSAFYSLFRQGSALYYRRPDNRVQRIHAADNIFDTLPNASLQHFEPELGHIYIMRFTPRGTQARDERLIKFRVIGHVPQQSITLRWSPIPLQKI